MPTTEIPHALATRFVALDVHRQYLMVGAVDSQQQVVLSPRRFGFAAFAEWATVHLTHADAVVFEATSNAWLLYDQLQPLPSRSGRRSSASSEADRRCAREDGLAGYD